jgi:hypothetical protein
MATQLELAIAIREQRDKEGAVTSPASEYRSQLVWTDHTVSYADAGGRRIELDFAAQLERRIDEHERTLTTRPLHAIVHMRSAEAKNRGLHIYEVLKAGGLPDNDFAPILAEHQCAASLPGRPRTVGKRSLLARLRGGPDIEVIERPVELDMKVGARCLMSVARDRAALPGAGPAFAQFLRYAFGGHPCLLQRIADDPRAPASITLRGLMPMQTGGEVTVRVIGPSDAAPAPSSAGFEARLDVDGSEPIDAVLRRDPAPAAAPLAARRAAALALLQGDTPLPGLLQVLELSLEQDVEMSPELAAAVRPNRDEVVPRFLALLQPPGSEADARERLEQLALLRDRAGRMAYLLGAFEAVLHRVLKQPSQAVAALTAVLEANPRITGAWKDLGELWGSSYDFTRAWLCWQRARAIAPEHRLLEDVARYQRDLEANHPEFFRVGIDA